MPPASFGSVASVIGGRAEAARLPSDAVQPRSDLPGGSRMTDLRTSRDVVVVGGCGHVGLPLGLAFASRGLRVTLFDVNASAVERVAAGSMPFDEPGAPEMLAQVLGDGSLCATTDPSVIAHAEHVVVVIGTPIDEHLNPDLNAVPAAISEIASYLRAEQLLVLRSTVYPGVTALVEKRMRRLGLDIDVAFCPERIAEGRAMTELFELPQIVSARTPRALARASALFSH